MLPGWKDVVTEIMVDKTYTDGLDGIEDYSHVIVVYWMNKEKECHLKHYPQGRGDVPFIGIFACRCPQRPNRIAISTVKLLSRKGNRIEVKGLDIVSGTPILDLIPLNMIRLERPKSQTGSKSLFFNDISGIFVRCAQNGRELG